MTDVKLWLRQFINEGYIAEKFSEDGKLTLYNYTNKCIYEKRWNKHTKNLRGHVYQVNPRRLISMAFPKFFNFGELAVSKQRNLLKKTNYKCYEKLDGSLGIIYYYEDKWRVNTRGSFNSEQAQEATKMLEKYDLSKVNKDITLLVEIIYPENQIIIKYDDRRELVLLAAYFNSLKTEIERMQLELISKKTNIPIVKEYDLTFDEMFEFQKNKDLTIEGFVVRFEDGYRVKIKSKKYLDIARVLSNLTPLSLWKTMDGGIVNQKSLEIIPEEFQEEIKEIVGNLEGSYQKLRDEIWIEFEKVKETNPTRKEIAQDKTLQHTGAIFCLKDNKYEKLDRYIMKRIRPKGDE